MKESRAKQITENRFRATLYIDKQLWQDVKPLVAPFSRTQIIELFFKIIIAGQSKDGKGLDLMKFVKTLVDAAEDSK